VSESVPQSDRDWDAIDDVPWTLLDLDELVDAYRSVVAPLLRADGVDPTSEKPTHQWLRGHDLRPLLYALREHHDETFSEFWTEHLATDRPNGGNSQSAAYWSTDDGRTVDALESFLESRRDRKGLAESSIDTLRYRLDRYVRAYVDATGTGDLLTPVARDSDAPAYEAVDACWAAFDALHDQLDGNQTKRRIHLAVSNWYAHLVRRKLAGVNPAEGLDDEFDWSQSADRSDSGTPCLSSAHVRSLYGAAADQEEQLLVLALCAWGLRPNEVASLHASQFVLDVPVGDVPYVEFDDRKNGPGEVSLLYGTDVLESRIATGVDDESWNGYLFPSPHASRDHVSRWTVWNRFDQLADRAGLPDKVDGVPPAPKMGRRYWYDAYSSSLDVVLESLDEIAAEQGSSSPAVVLRNYLSESRVRDLRREHMRDQLADAFE
jgi:site-specific recombinase XerD